MCVHACAVCVQMHVEVWMESRVPCWESLIIFQFMFLTNNTIIFILCEYVYVFLCACLILSISYCVYVLCKVSLSKYVFVSLCIYVDVFFYMKNFLDFGIQVASHLYCIPHLKPPDVVLMICLVQSFSVRNLISSQ